MCLFYGGILMWFLYLVCLIIALIIDYIIAKKFSDIAEMKGHYGGTYFWFTFLFGLVGMLMVIALPTITPKNVNTTILPPAKDIFKNVRDTSKQQKRCPHCGDIVKSDRCEMCGKEVK